MDTIHPAPITAKIIADSIDSRGHRMTTMEIEYPRFILAELNTHRMLSKNSASSRAIPVTKMHEHIAAFPAEPVSWGKNQSGMQAKEEFSPEDVQKAKEIWYRAMQDALRWSKELSSMSLHKQVANRITEPWMMMKTVISGTEWKNLFYLRCHGDAQPEFRHLALKMQEAYNASTPQLLAPGEWHVPYVLTHRDKDNQLLYLDSDAKYITMEHARMISASCCAQVSYRKSDESFEKAAKIFDLLINSKPAHASPVEHQATPMSLTATITTNGVTHQDHDYELWSGNLREWIQFRKIIPEAIMW